MEINIAERFLLITTLLLFLTVQAGLSVKRKEYSMKMNKVWCDFDPKFFKDPYCGVKPHRDQKGRFTVRATIIKELKTLNVTVRLNQKTNFYRPFLLHYTVDVCKMMSGKGMNLLHRLSHLVMAKISNCNHTCPFMGLFEIKNAVIETGWIPSVLPDGFYRFDTKGVNEDGYVGAMQFYITVTNPEF